MKEKIISHILSVETLSKLYFEFNIYKLFYFKNDHSQRVKKLYKSILSDNSKIYSLRDYLYYSGEFRIEEDFHSLEINEKIDYFRL